MTLSKAVQTLIINFRSILNLYVQEALLPACPAATIFLFLFFSFFFSKFNLNLSLFTKHPQSQRTYVRTTFNKIKNLLCTSLIVLIGDGVLIKKLPVLPPRKHYLISFKITMLVSINDQREYFRSTFCGIMTTDATVVVLNHTNSRVLMKPPLSRACQLVKNTAWIFILFLHTHKVKENYRKCKNRFDKLTESTLWLNIKYYRNLSVLVNNFFAHCYECSVVAYEYFI